jgi:hypothetical protein
MTIPQKPSDLKTAAELQREREPDERLAISTQFIFGGRVFTVQFSSRMRAESLARICSKLDELGAEPLPIPVVTTPDGEPYCPKHRVPMRAREKQGDTWHSHVVEAEAGQVAYCKGRPGKDSPGWEYP